MNRSRRSMIAFFTVLGIGLGTATVEGMPVCERLVKTMKEHRVRNPVSKKTLAAWALWGQTHPNFKSHPRPKYKMVHEEVVEKVDFACQVPKIPETPTLDLIPTFGEVEFPPEPVDFLPPELPPVTLVAVNETPPLPFVPPYSPSVPPETPAPVPEPSTWLLLCTGAGFVMFLARYRQSKSTVLPGNITLP
jgi:hypothetical protein